MNNLHNIAFTGQLDSVSVGNLNILLDVVLTHKLVVPGTYDPKAGSDLEFYGYSEMDFLITEGEYWDGTSEDGDAVWRNLSTAQLAELEDKYQNDIEEALWDLSDKAEFDNAEPNKYPA